MATVGAKQGEVNPATHEKPGSSTLSQAARKNGHPCYSDGQPAEDISHHDIMYDRLFRWAAVFTPMEFMEDQ